MKIMPCPINGPRPIQEFVYGGVVREQPDPQEASDEDWGAYVHHRDGAPGIKREWWYHAASGVWFIAERDTEKDEILKTYLYGAGSSDE